MSDFSIFSKTSFDVAFWIGSGSMLLAAMLAGLTILLRFKHRRDKLREQAFVTLWHPVLMQALAGDVMARLPVLHRRDHLMFLRHWNHFQETVRGEACDRLNQLARRLEMDAVARGLLRRSDQTEQLLAIMTLGQLREATVWDELMTLSQSADSTLSVFAARALVQIEPQQAARHILPLLLQRDDWDIMRTASLLQDSQDVLGQDLIGRLAGLPRDHLLRGLKLAEVLHLKLPPGEQISLLAEQQPVEVVIAGLRLASGGAGVLDAIRGRMADTDWRVRVQVARALGRIGDASDVARLVEMMKDSQWWVRYRAAHALVVLPFLKSGQLDQLQASLADRYARDILRQVFAERDQLAKSAG